MSNAVITIDFMHYQLPLDKAIQVMKLMAEAKCTNYTVEGYTNNGKSPELKVERVYGNNEPNRVRKAITKTTA